MILSIAPHFRPPPAGRIPVFITIGLEFTFEDENDSDFDVTEKYVLHFPPGVRLLFMNRRGYIFKQETSIWKGPGSAPGMNSREKGLGSCPRYPVR